MTRRTFYKDPQDVVNYRNNWGKRRLPAGVTITSSVVTPGTGITLDTSSFTDRDTYYRISGGTLNEVYEVLNHVVCDNGEEWDWTTWIVIQSS